MITVAPPVITAASLAAAGVGPTEAARFAAPLSAACSRFGIVTPAQLGGFIAQCRIESAGFKVLRENMAWRDPVRLDATFSAVRGVEDAKALIARGPIAIANRVYADRLGNGNEASGDGARYIGRGLKQLTGRANYREAGIALARPYAEMPELVEQPDDACLTAAWFWASHKLGLLAEAKQWDAITRVVNGPGMLQAKERAALSEQCCRVFA